MSEDEARPVAGLALPFALYGAVVGFFAVLLFSVVDRGCRFVNPWVSALSASLAGWLYGASVVRSRSLGSLFVSRDVVLLRLGAGLLVAGTFAGLSTGTLTVLYSPSSDPRATIAASATAGAIVGVALLPAAYAVFSAAKEASKARRGSVVARADAVRVRLVLAGTLSCIALGGLPAIALGNASLVLGADLQLALSTAVPLVSVLAVATAAYASHRSLTELGALVERRATCSPADAGDATSSSVADVGLGDEAWAAIRLGHAYRGARAASVVLRGDVDWGRLAILKTQSKVKRALTYSLSASVCVVALGALALSEARRNEVSLEAEDEVRPPPPRELRAIVPVWVGASPSQGPIEMPAARVEAWGTGIGRFPERR